MRRSVSPPCSARRCLPSCSERRDQLAAGRGAGGFHIDSVVPWLLACTLCISLLNVALCDNLNCDTLAGSGSHASSLLLCGALTLWSSHSLELSLSGASLCAPLLWSCVALSLARSAARWFARGALARSAPALVRAPTARARLRVWRIAQHAAARRSRAAGLGAQRRQRRSLIDAQLQVLAQRRVDRRCLR